MSTSKWFDSKSNELMFDCYVERMESWQEAIADGVIEPQEIEQQAGHVAKLLQELEPQLSPELHEQLTEVFYELAVLYGMAQWVAVTQATQSEQA